MLCLGDDSGPSLHSRQLVRPHMGCSTGAIQFACCVRSAIDITRLYWIKGLSASTNYSKERIGFYKTPKLAFIRSTLIHFSSSGLLFLPYDQCLLELRGWQGDVMQAATSWFLQSVVILAYTHGVAKHKNQEEGMVMGLTWHHGQQQQQSPPPSGPPWVAQRGTAMRAVPAGSVCRGRFFTETSAIVVLAEVTLVKAGKSSAKSSSDLQKGKLQFSTLNMHSQCRKKTTKVRNE